MTCGLRESRQALQALPFKVCNEQTKTSVRVNNYAKMNQSQPLPAISSLCDFGRGNHNCWVSPPAPTTTFRRLSVVTRGCPLRFRVARLQGHPDKCPSAKPPRCSALDISVAWLWPWLLLTLVLRCCCSVSRQVATLACFPNAHAP